MSLHECNQVVDEWYRETTKMYDIPTPPSRALNIMLAIEKMFGSLNSLCLPKQLAAVEIKVSSDPLWAERRNRTENERRGVMIGKGKSKGKKGKPEFWYLVPKEKEAEK